MMTPAGVIILYVCCKRAARPTAMYVVRHGHLPRSLEGPGAFVKFKASATTYFMITRNHTRTRTRSPVHRDPHP